MVIPDVVVPEHKRIAALEKAMTGITADVRELAEKTARLAELAEARIAALEKCYGKDSVSVGLERLSQRFAALEARLLALEEWAADGGPVHGFTLPEGTK